MYKSDEDKSYISKTEMEEKLIALLGGRAAEKIALDDIIDFHFKFERIHPFVDGNGPLGQQKTYLQKYLQNKVFTDFGKSFFKYTI